MENWFFKKEQAANSEEIGIAPSNAVIQEKIPKMKHAT